MDYPLSLSFKILALAPQIAITDARGASVFYVKQAFFKLKEAVTVFADPAQTRPLYTIQADRILDFSARYHFATVQGQPLGAIRRHGMRSLWSAHYEIESPDAGGDLLTVREENPWIKVLDGLFGEIPILGLLSGYVFNPAYQVVRPDGTVVMRLQKEPALLESHFRIECPLPLPAAEEPRVLLGLLMLLLLERTRG